MVAAHHPGRPRPLACSARFPLRPRKTDRHWHKIAEKMIMRTGAYQYESTNRSSFGRAKLRRSGCTCAMASSGLQAAVVRPLRGLDLSIWLATGPQTACKSLRAPKRLTRRLWPSQPQAYQLRETHVSGNNTTEAQREDYLEHQGVWVVSNAVQSHQDTGASGSCQRQFKFNGPCASDYCAKPQGAETL
jgi:hypothetical protein